MVKPMRKRSVIAFCFLGLIILAALVQCGFAQSFEAIYIDSEGTVRGTDSIQRIGDKYTLIHNVFGNLTVQREDAIVDGAGYILEGDGKSTGILLTSKNVTITNFHLTNHYSAISSNADNNTISANYITKCTIAITTKGNSAVILKNYVENSDQGITIQGNHTYVSKNNLVYNRLGIVFNNGNNYVKYSIITENSVTNNGLTILVTSPAADNLIYNNNFAGSNSQVNFQNISNGVNVHNAWDNGTIGNYWSDYLTTYPNAKEIGSTGTGNTPYTLTHNPTTLNVDNHPLLNPVAILDLAQGPQKFPSTSNENTWRKMASMPTARGGLGVAVVNGKIYAIGGLSYASHLSTNEMYDPSTNTWTTMAAMPTARSDFAIAVYQNKIYCIGGETGPGEMGAVIVTGANEVYDPATNTWEQKATLPTPRNEMQANVVNEKIYVIGGTQCLGILHHQSFNNNDVYDPENDSWSTASALPVASWSYASTVLDDKIYVVSGGAQKGVNQIYDPLTNTWVSGAAIPSKFFSLGATASSTTGVFAPKRIYVMGGTTGGISAVSVNQAYNPYDNSWSTVASMPTARYGHSVVNVNDTLYAIGGATGLASGPSGGWIPTNANEQYLPISYGTTELTYQTPAPTLSSSPVPSPSLTTTDSTTQQPTFSPNPTATAPELPAWTALPVAIMLALAAILITKSTHHNKIASKAR